MKPIFTLAACLGTALLVPANFASAQKPVCNSPYSITLSHGASAYTFTPGASDPLGRPLTFSLTGISGSATKGTATINSMTGAITYTPKKTKIGADSVIWKCNNGVINSNNALVNVTLTNDAPIVVNPGTQTYNETQSVSIPVSASDADSDKLSYSATGLPTGVSINSTTGLISGTAQIGTVGSHTVQVTATDVFGATGVTSFAININSNAVDVTGLFSVTYSAVTARPGGGWQQALTITNTSGGPIQGPISVVVDNLSGAMSVVLRGGSAPNGWTTLFAPNGSPYFNLSTSATNLATGVAKGMGLWFNGGSTPISYSVRILAHPGTR